MRKTSNSALSAMSERKKTAGTGAINEDEPLELASNIELAQSLTAFREWRRRAVDKAGAVKVGLVPTMGALHAGHMSLIEQAKKDCDIVVVSIFVNPLQFGPNEDYTRYPRTLSTDMKMLSDAGVHCVFNPSVEELYGQGAGTDATTVVVPPRFLIERLCGEFRPGHFEGVATVVCKLCNVVRPDYAYFGEKDYQQLQVVQRLVSDLNLNLEIRPVPIVREHDGLALSSRNAYLSKEERAKAPLIYQTLLQVKKHIFAENVPVEQALAEGRKRLGAEGFEVQYLQACDAETLAFLDTRKIPMVILTAAKLGAVRLIDNIIIRD